MHSVPSWKKPKEWQNTWLCTCIYTRVCMQCCFHEMLYNVLVIKAQGLSISSFQSQVLCCSSHSSNAITIVHFHLISHLVVFGQLMEMLLCARKQRMKKWLGVGGGEGGVYKKGKGLLINFITIKWNNFLLTEDLIWGAKRWRLTCLPLASRVDFSRVQRKDLLTPHPSTFFFNTIIISLQASSSFYPCSHFDYLQVPCNQTSVCIFSILFSIFFLRCWLGEFV